MARPLAAIGSFPAAPGSEFSLPQYRTHILRLSLPGARPNPPEGILSRDGSMPRLGEMTLALPADLIVRAHCRVVTLLE